MAESPNSIAPPLKSDAVTAPPFARPRWVRWLAVILVLWLALFLRVWQLDVLPPGLHYDEAFNGTMARDVLRGTNRPVFFTPNFGEEPLHIYTEAVSFALFGESPWAIRLVSAVFGVVFVAAIYACARVLFPDSDLLALTAAFLAATLYWAINFSRIGIEPNGLPMLIALSAAALGHAYRKMTWRWVIASGFLIGATVYTYLASRLWPPAVLLWFVYLFLFHRQATRAHFSKWVVMGVVVFLTLAPLVLFFAANPVALSGRSGTVFTPENLLANLAKTAGMFVWQGDTDPRDNLPGRPALDLVLFAFFSLGLILALVRFRKPFHALVLIWLVVMCLPSVLTEFAPNFRRAIGALPATILLCAMGVDWLWLKLSGFASRSPGLARAGQVAILAVLGLSALLSSRAYFVEWAGSPGLFYSFDAGLLKVAQTLAARPQDEDLYLSPDYDAHYTVIWGLNGRPVASFDGRRVLVLANSGRAATYGIITREDKETLASLDKSSIDVEPLTSIADLEHQPYARVARVAIGEGDAWLASKTSARVGDFAELAVAGTGPSEYHRGGHIPVSLEWRAKQPVSFDYTVFAQLVGPPNPSTGTRIWAQADRQPGNGTYPTSTWRAGDAIRENYELEIPPEAAPGEYQVLVGIYLLETGERVPLYGADGAQLRNDALVVKTLTLD